jgi:hypothetical protein
MYKCNTCSLKFDNRFVLANHVRWNHKDNTKYVEKIRDIKNKEFDDKLGKFIVANFKCSNDKCNNDVHINHRSKTQIKKKIFCSRSCANTRNLSDDTKSKISESLKKTKKSIRCIYDKCDNEFLPKKKSTRYCSISCGRLANVKEKTGYDLYKSQTTFSFNVYDYSDEFQLSLLEKHGWYSAANRGNNLNGISRDHMYSVMEGFRNNIDPNLLSHPANCKLMKHNDNVSKLDKCSISLDELKMRIKKWDEKYN